MTRSPLGGGLGVRKTLDPSAPGDEVYLPQGEHTLKLRGIDHVGTVLVQEEVTVLVQEGDEGGRGDQRWVRCSDRDEDGETDFAVPDADGNGVHDVGCGARNTSTGRSAVL